MKVCIVGGGASGLMAASFLSKNGADVILLERNEKLGKKIYITGKGRCNFTNACSCDEFIKNVVSNPRFLFSAINSFTPYDTIDFFETNGLRTKEERGRRMFPLSDKSNDVIKALSNFSSNVKIRLNTRVSSLIISDGYVLGVRLDDGEQVFADAVILCTGGMSYQSTGSTGDGYKMCKSVGHTLVEPKSALAPIICKNSECKTLEGLSLKNVEVKAFVNGKEFAKEFGEMLFTAQGVSGPCILTISSKICRLNLKGAYLTIDLKPALSYEVLDERIRRDFSKAINKQFKNSLDELLPKSLIDIIVEKSGIDPYKKVNQVTTGERKNLVSLIKNYTLEIMEIAPFSQAVITSGGINVKEVNPRTMESKIVKNLYVVGELLDVDALTGGYNLQIAFSTAVAAANAIMGE